MKGCRSEGSEVHSSISTVRLQLLSTVRCSTLMAASALSKIWYNSLNTIVSRSASLYDTSSSLDEPVPPETLASSPTLVGDTLTPRLASGFAVYDEQSNRAFQGVNYYLVATAIRSPPTSARSTGSTTA